MPTTAMQTTGRDLPRMPFHAYISLLIANGPKKQRDIAEDLGYNRPHIISLFKSGDTKVPLNKIPALAKSLGADPQFLLRYAMHEYMPEVLETIEQAFGTLLLSANEIEIVRFIRSATDETDPKLRTSEQKAALKQACDKLVGDES